MWGPFLSFAKKYKRGVANTLFVPNELNPQECLKTCSLGELFPFIRNGFVGTVTPYFTDEAHGVRYLQGTNIHAGRITDDTVFYVSQEFSGKHSKNILKADDILVVQSGHVGECAAVGEKYAGANCHALIIMSNGGNCISEYVAQYINSDIGIRKIAAITTGNTIKHILASAMIDFEIPIPSLDEQNRIARFLSACDQLIDIEDQLLAELTKMKDGLLQRLFI